MKELITIALGFLTNITSTNDDREQRRNLRAFKKHRRKIYRIYKKNGISKSEQSNLDALDFAYVKMILDLGKF